MNVIVPLAGPDFEVSDSRVKAEVLTAGNPLLLAALHKRPWMQASGTGNIALTFILRDSPNTKRFANGPLRDWFPDARQVFISEYTDGAALSALAGVACSSTNDRPFCVDLADILYDCTFDPMQAFEREQALGGVALTFQSDNPVYSYLDIDESGYVTRAAEKVVISSHASAGTYWFRSFAVYLRAMAHALENRHIQTYNGRFFVCPLYNGVIDQGLRVRCGEVSNIQDVKILANASGAA